jgi:predicted O-methyltransferase YrrM
VLVTEMTGRASESLYSILTGYPPAVFHAKRRAGELGFAKSCTDNVGRLLTLLAATLPSEGRILEIGTGAGVGLAWIIEGLGKRTDVEVVSLEVDAKLIDGTRGWPWPAYVQLETADAAKVLGTLGTFSLIFADAAPFKYDHIVSVIEMLRPGGLLVIDDIEATIRTAGTVRAEIDALRRTVLGHPGLHAVEIEWGTGLLVAARSHS